MAPDDRLFYNGNCIKPERKRKEIKCAFGQLTPANFEQFRILNYLTLPVVYSEDFYDRLINQSRYSQMAYIKDILVGAISTRYEGDPDAATDHSKKGKQVVYIMTITVLKNYRRYGIAS